MTDKFLYLLTSMLLLPSLLHSQSIVGTVLDSADLQPIVNANIYIEKLSTGTYTDDTGKFKMRIEKNQFKKNDSILFSHINYKSQKVKYGDFLKNNKKIVLIRKTELLSEVEIQNKRKLNPSLRFRELNPMKIPVHNFGSILVNDKIYVSGGEQISIYEGYREHIIDRNQEYQEPNSLTLQQMAYEAFSNYYIKDFSNKMQVYDIENDRWLIEDSLILENRAYHNINLINNKLYIIGGKKQSKRRNFEFLSTSIEIYNLETKELIVDQTNPHQAVQFSSTVYNNDLITLGGSIRKFKNGSLKYISNSYVFDTETGEWHDLDFGNLNMECKGLIIGQKVYLLEKSATQFELNSFDLNTKDYVKLFELDVSQSIGSMTSSGNMIYFYGMGTVYTYDTDTMILEQYYLNLPIKEPNIHATSDKIYILGGYYESDFNVDSVDRVYEIELSEFARTSVVRYTQINPEIF